MNLRRLKHYIKLYMPYKWVLEYEEKRDFFAQYFAWKDSNLQVEFDTESKFENIIAVQGFGYSGSGAVVDLLREYDDCLVHGMAEGGSKAVVASDDLGEIHFVTDTGGLVDIDHIVDTHFSFMDNAVLHRFAYMMQHESVYVIGGKYRAYIFNFFKSLIKYEVRDVPGSIAAATPRLRENRFSLIDLTKKEYYNLCQQFIYSVFNLQYDGKHKFLVLDQFCSSKTLNFEPDYCRNFVPNLKTILVYRDPRDIYVIAKDEDIQWIEHDSVENFIQSTKARYEGLDPLSSSYLAIRFEDLILDYEKTVTKIEKYLNLGEHKRPMSCLDTSISCENIGKWKKSKDIPQEDFDKIYKAFPEYCFNK